MERKVKFLSTIYLLFLVLLFISGALHGAVGEVAYFLAFLLPFALAVAYQKKNNEFKPGYLRFDRETIAHTLVFCAPTVTVVMLFSIITSFIIRVLTGQNNNVDIGDSVFIALISNALLPAVLEEMLFRFVPIQMLSSHSKRATVLLSAFFFAMIHHNFFSIPYAFIAGIVFVSLDLAFESIWPSIIIHFLNNVVSVLFIFGYRSIVLPFVLVLGFISVVIIAFTVDKYRKLFASTFLKGEKFNLIMEFVAFAAVTALIAVSALF